MKTIAKKLLIRIFTSLISEIIAFFALEKLKKRWKKQKQEEEDEEEEWKELIAYKLGIRKPAA